MASGFFFGKQKRFAQRAENNLGIIRLDDKSGGIAGKQWRSDDLHRYDQYYDGMQYESLVPWNDALSSHEYVPVRQRQPRINYCFAKVLSSRLASKLVGESTFPTFKIEEDLDTAEFIKAIIKTSKLKSRMIEPIRRMINSGSVFVRFYMTGRTLHVEHYNANYCYPKFDESNELELIEIKYVYESDEIDPGTKKPKKKWYKMELSKTSDVLYNNPDFTTQITDPIFEEVNRVDHNLGLVQGEWFKTSEAKHSPDGYAIVSDITDFIDEMNYSMSQSSQAVGYNQDPQLAVNAMDEDEITKLIRSSQKAWNLGREGTAQFLETNLSGVKTAQELRDKVRLSMQDIARIILLDPEKMVANAQSGKAMEVLHGPMIELINELRPMVEQGLTNLLLKIAITLLTLNMQGVTELPIQIPPGYQPISFNLITEWPPIFAMTMEDLRAKVQVITSATAGNLISRETGTRFLAKDFNVDDIEAEIARIASQPVINPFGGF